MWQNPLFIIIFISVRKCIPVKMLITFQQDCINRDIFTTICCSISLQYAHGLDLLCNMCSYIHYDQVMPYDNIGLGQHSHRQWLGAWWHQAITWSNVDSSSIRPRNINLRAISKEIPQLSTTIISLKIIYVNFDSNPPGANGLTLLWTIRYLYCGPPGNVML